MDVRYRAKVEYDGTDFLGFQIQAQGRTVQGELERAIERITQQEVRVLGAGRTDAGVHASGQVIVFDVVWRQSISDLQRALNAVLPPDIAVSHLARTHSTFHPRYDAKWRRYRYTIFNWPVRSPLWSRVAHHVPEPLDVEAMRESGRLFIGSHDFASFGKPTYGESTVRHVMETQWFVEYPGERVGRLLIFEIAANAFLYRMVRRIVGTLIEVGRGQLSPGEIARLLEVKDRAATGPPAPACGLCLVRVAYEETTSEA